MTKYAIEVSWSDDDDAWIASLPDLPYCTAHGPTPHDAVAEAEIAVQAWLPQRPPDGPCLNRRRERLTPEPHAAGFTAPLGTGELGRFSAGAL